MVATVNANTTTGVVVTSDTSGALALQTAGTTALTISSAQAISFTNTISTPNTFGFKNRIINGGMTIDQRNAGASVTPTNGQYTLDRWVGFVSGSAGRYSVAQSTTVPSGFYNSMLITSTAATTLGTSDYYIMAQRIEQNNLFDLGWGASGASSVTLSFKVYSSVAGTFNGYLYAYTATQQSYPFTYTVSSPNTWTSISVVIPGPTTGGLFSSPTSPGLILGFTLGTGSSYATLSSSAWISSFQTGLTGGSNFLATSGATLYITGVQLEVGTQATSFDFRSIGTELALCQRYYEMIGDVLGGSTVQILFVDAYAPSSGSTTAQYNWSYKQQKRATPTVATYGSFSTSNLTGGLGTLGISPMNALLYGNPASAGRLYWYNNAASGWYASAEL